MSSVAQRLEKDCAVLSLGAYPHHTYASFRASTCQQNSICRTCGGGALLCAIFAFHASTEDEGRRAYGGVEGGWPIIIAGILSLKCPKPQRVQSLSTSRSHERIVRLHGMPSLSEHPVESPIPCILGTWVFVAEDMVVIFSLVLCVASQTGRHHPSLTFCLSVCTLFSGRANIFSLS